MFKSIIVCLLIAQTTAVSLSSTAEVERRHRRHHIKDVTFVGDDDDILNQEENEDKQIMESIAQAEK